MRTRTLASPPAASASSSSSAVPARPSWDSNVKNPAIYRLNPQEQARRKAALQSSQPRGRRDKGSERSQSRETSKREALSVPTSPLAGREKAVAGPPSGSLAARLALGPMQGRSFPQGGGKDFSHAGACWDWKAFVHERNGGSGDRSSPQRAFDPSLTGIRSTPDGRRENASQKCPRSLAGAARRAEAAECLASSKNWQAEMSAFQERLSRTQTSRSSLSDFAPRGARSAASAPAPPRQLVPPSPLPARWQRPQTHGRKSSSSTQPSSSSYSSHLPSSISSSTPKVPPRPASHPPQPAPPHTTTARTRPVSVDTPSSLTPRDAAAFFRTLLACPPLGPLMSTAEEQLLRSVSPCDASSLPPSFLLSLSARMADRLSAMQEENEVLQARLARSEVRREGLREGLREGMKEGAGASQDPLSMEKMANDVKQGTPLASIPFTKQPSRGIHHDNERGTKNGELPTSGQQKPSARAAEAIHAMKKGGSVRGGREHGKDKTAALRVSWLDASVTAEENAALLKALEGIYPAPAIERDRGCAPAAVVVNGKGSEDPGSEGGKEASLASFSPATVGTYLGAPAPLFEELGRWMRPGSWRRTLRPQR
ncbi:hypothetical protein NSK_008790 [Nannochloropsis salina CCMP1776]|uniref:Uncharacterized protein n=1 Tax=Nannochloropsis salina CCMP1776 TaxID=1027361 RepID=A0A4D9CM72_9STRA|nr:hypothetical protein NSK_008790 [Nannochloropsis salina CCMP1776]|eukprot:TFJ79856.1 hypothetical protein NSK_008790 [Nannochloropsis salina CCMP1776]